MKKNVSNEIVSALNNLLAQANNAMINAIISVVQENGDATYEETIDDTCGYTELRFIRYNEDGDLCVFNENGNELYYIEDMSADQLYDICVKIS